MYTLSIILNLHREGEIVEKTIKNLRYVIYCARKAQQNWDKVEVIAVLDNPDYATQNIVNANRDLFAKIELVHYGDPALSRNHGAEIANNNFILFADGDDYCSHNSLIIIYDIFKQHYSQFKLSTIEFINSLEYKDHIAIFPQLIVVFPKMWIATYVDSNEYIKDNMKFHHCYISRICCWRKIILGNKMTPVKIPYGYEDWDLNNRLLALGVSFKTPHDYIFYYRKGNIASTLNTHINNKCIVRNSDLYDYNPNLENSNFLVEKLQRGDFKNSRSRVKLALNKVATELGIIDNQRIEAKPDTKEQLIIKYKNFLLNYHEDLLEGEIGFDSYKTYSEQVTVPVKLYQQLREFMQGKLLVCFFSFINDTNNELLDNMRELNVDEWCVVTTVAFDPTIIKQIRLPYLDLNRMCHGWESLAESDKMHIMIKAIINSSIKSIYISDSNFALQLITYYHSIFQEYGIAVNETKC